MMRAMFSGVAGLKTHQTKMDVIGNNISNVNTLAFKASSTTFSDIMYQTTSGATGATQRVGGKNAKQIGLGAITASTKMTITSGGAAQSTGDGLDLKLTDTNSTNFFIVSNGSENLFTRAGSFYIDGNGNLAMTSTGYLVQGWQVDPETGDIRKDTVSALRVMQASNLTSAPEATTKANVSGVIDKKDTNVTSDSGYYRSLTFYDNLGYSYSAKFAIKNVGDPDNGSYTVELISITDSDSKDVLAAWMAADPANNTLAKVFGQDTMGTRSYTVTSDFKATDTGITMQRDGQTYTMINNIVENPTGSGTYGVYFSPTGGGTDQFVSLGELYGVSDDMLDQVGGAAGMSIATGGVLTLEYPTTNYDLQFLKADGTFSFVGSEGNNSVSLNMSALGPQFQNIDMDFSKCLNYNNSASSTVEMERGDAAQGTDGTGKRLGTMTGLSINGDGKIFASYDNGNTVLLGQIAVAQFANASGLEALGNNCFTTTLNSGDFDGIGVDVTADGGSMNSGQLEMSNVDLSTEFTDMITTQRGFQANSRIITTSDTLLEELVNLKR